MATRETSTNPSRLAWAAAAAAVAGGALHSWEIYCYHSRLNGLPVIEQKIAGLKTENGFYYSFYEEVVSAPSWATGVWAALRDRRSEAPDTINAVERFNIHQELICGTLYRLLRWAIGEERLLDSWYFFRYCMYALNGLGRTAIVVLAASYGGGGLRGGVLTGLALILMLWLHAREVSRLHEASIINLREYWACPALWAQLLCLYRVVLCHPVLQGRCGNTASLNRWRIALCGCSVACIILWQFSAFVFLLQVSAVFLCALLSCSRAGRKVCFDIVVVHLGAAGLAALCLFWNELLVNHLLVTQCVAIFITLHFRSRRPPLRERLCLFWVDGLWAVVFFVILRLIQSRWATADDHLAELAIAKFRQLIPSLPGKTKQASFNARLYLAVSVFNFIDMKTVKMFLPTAVLPLAGVGALLSAFAFARRVVFISTGSTVASTNVQGLVVAASADITSADKHVDEAKPSSGDDASSKRKDNEPDPVLGWGDPTAYAVAFANGVFVVELALLAALGCFIDRLRVLGAPLICVLAAVAFAPQPLEAAFGPGAGRGTGWWGPRCRGCVWHTLTFAAVLAQFAQLALLASKMPFLGERSDAVHQESFWHEAETGELCDWMNRHEPAKVTIMTSMSLAGQMRAVTPFRFVIHPQFESLSLRERVQETYKFYQCTDPGEFLSTMQKFGATVFIIEYKRCDFSPFVLDQFPEVNCDREAKAPFVRAAEWKELFCVRLHTSPYFKMVFGNAGYGVFHIRKRAAVDKALKPTAASIEHIAAWRPMLERCLREDPEVCGGRIAELASVFHEKLKQPKVANVLFSWVRDATPNDGIAQYMLGRHMDYQVKRPADATKHYRRAYELVPNNAFIVREYLMWLDVELNDNRTLERLLRTRRFTDGGRLSLLDLQDASLACEASVAALELLRDFDWAMDLWTFATTEGAASSCVENNWPIFSGGRKMKEDVGEWGMFRNVFLMLRLRSHLSTTQLTPVRWQSAHRPWECSVAPAFTDT